MSKSLLEEMAEVLNEVLNGVDEFWADHEGSEAMRNARAALSRYSRECEGPGEEKDWPDSEGWWWYELRANGSCGAVYWTGQSMTTNGKCFYAGRSFRHFIGDARFIRLREPNPFAAPATAPTTK